MDEKHSFSILLLLLLYAENVLACGGGGYYYSWVPEPKESDSEEYYAGNDTDEAVTPNYNLTKMKDAVDRNKNSWQGWDPPPEVVADWREWYHNHKVKINNTNFVDPNDPEAAARLEQERGPGWPPEWHSLGVGQSGVPPPPWSYTPRDTGKPSYCLYPLRVGKCQKLVLRWAFHPYLDVCVNFTWSGCGGNQNNFETELQCKEVCEAPAPSGCDPDSHIYPEDLKV